MTSRFANIATVLLTIGLLVACDSGGEISESDPTEAPSSSSSTFDIRLRFMGDFTSAQKTTVRDALDPWTNAINGDLASVSISSGDANNCLLEEGEIEDFALVVQKKDLDGSGGKLAQASPCLARTDAQGNVTTAASGIVEIDESDIGNPALEKIVTHEVGHALGLGTTAIPGWDANLFDLDTQDPFYDGSNAKDAFRKIGGEAYLSLGVPVANTGGQGTFSGHWREANFDNELMTGFLNPDASNPLSRVSLAALKDIGYPVDLSTADAYSLPMPQTAIWQAEADATLSTPASADENFGTPDDGTLGTAIVAGNNNSKLWSSDPEDEIFSGLLQFNVPTSLPSEVTLQKAKIELVVQDLSTETNMHEIKIFEVTENWEEDQVTEDSAPSTSSSAAASYDFQPSEGDSECARPQSNQCKDLTALATDWITGRASNHGITLEAPDASTYPASAFSIGYYSRHASSPLQRPILVVQATTAPSALTEKSHSSGEKIPLGDDIRKGTIYGVDSKGNVVRTKRLR